MRIQLVILLFLLPFITISQQKFEWIEKEKYPIDSSDIWTTDVLGNTYITKKEVIHKYDSIGTLKFSQSQKSIGRLASIQPINTMKLVIFSEEQQEFCFLDNTLTPYGTCIDLIDQNIGNATIVAVSSQPDKFWVYDQLNSRLHLLSLAETDQAQEIENLRGLLNSTQITFMVEQNNLLYLVDPSQGVYLLDMYGSLVDLIKKSEVKGIQVDLDNLYVLEKDQISIINLDTDVEIKVDCPFENVLEFRKSGKNYYFRTETEIKKYQLLFNE